MRNLIAPLLISLLVAGGMTARVAMAARVSPANCTIPKVVPIVGTDALGNLDPRGQFKVVVRGFLNTPLAGSLVILEFPACSATRIASTGYPPGITVDCRPDHRSVRRLTNAQGEASFTIPATARPECGQSTACVTISADGAFIGNAGAATADLNGADGVGIDDLSVWLFAFGLGDTSLSDYDGDHVVGINDRSLWLEIYGAVGSIATPRSSCQ